MNRAKQLKMMAMRFGPIFAENNMKEQEALMGYYRLLNEIDSYCYDMSIGPNGDRNKVVEEFWQKYMAPLREQVEEIIGDELNHSGLLTDAMIKFCKVKPSEV